MKNKIVILIISAVLIAVAATGIYSHNESSSIGIIGGADGPTAVMVSGSPVAVIIAAVIAVILLIILTVFIIKRRKKQ